MPDAIQIHDLKFVPFLSADTVQQRVANMAAQLRQSHGDKQPVFLVMLKGAFVFAADLFRHFPEKAEISFVRTRSYAGTQSSRQVELILGPELKEVQGRHVILVEDIVDSGHTMQAFLPQLQAMSPASLTLVTLLFKPDMLECEVPIDHVGFTIPPKFVVGYGLDYDGLGRNLPAIYQLADTEA
jgi:hypoxanthine phosphoribosyltransferase